MHLYWRVMEELRYLGEILVFYDPSLRRAYHGWIRRNSDVLALNGVGAVPAEGNRVDGRGATAHVN